MLWRAILQSSWRVRVSALAGLLIFCVYPYGAGDARARPGDAETPVGPDREGLTPVNRGAVLDSEPETVEPDRAGPPEEARPLTLTPTPEAAGADVPTSPKVEMTEAEIHTDPPPSPGAKLGLEAGRKFQGMRFHWFQVEGPAVEIAEPSRSSIQVTIPDRTEKLGFVLVAARPDLVRVVRISVPIHGSAAGAAAAGDVSQSRTSWGLKVSGKVKADAGDDQVGLIGHRVTLNGSRSVPGDGKSARWLQVAGPAVSRPEQQGAFFSFVPVDPGVYRFLLVVAGDGEVSEPDDVTVLVGSLPAAVGGLPPQQVQAPAPPPPLPTPAEILSGALPGLPDGSRVASDVADVMEAISERAPLYSTFAALQNELARRLDLVVPADPAARAAWNQRVFTPLTAYTTGQLLAAGMDVRQPQGLNQPLSAAQREKIRDQFQTLARAFRAAVASR